jgi:hypothetical protein
MHVQNTQHNAHKKRDRDNRALHYRVVCGQKLPRSSCSSVDKWKSAEVANVEMVPENASWPFRFVCPRFELHHKIEMEAESAEHADLEAWARKFGGTAILGFISTLLLSGKFIHHIFQRRGLIFGVLVIPPVLISGLIGLVWFTGMEFLDPIMTADMRLGLEAMKGNLISFVFAALILGITCGRANSQHNASFRGIITSLFHEGMPMVIYSQLLNWGQTTCCLLLVCVSNTFFNAKIPRVFAAMVPLGLEAGADISVSSNYKVRCRLLLLQFRCDMVE